MLGTLIALELAIGVLLGLLVLHQQPSPAQLAGILLAVLAGRGRGRRAGGARPRPDTPAPAANSTSAASPGSTVAIAAALTYRFHARPESSAEAATTPATPGI
jgi:hypothetical protein